MIRAAAVLALALLPATSTLAQNGGAAEAAALPALLEAALADAEARAADAPALAFTRTVTMGGETLLSARYDPAGPEGERWTVLAQAEGELARPAEAMLEGWRAEEDPGAEMIVGEPREIVGGAVVVVREDADAVVYAVPVPEELEAEGMAIAEHLLSEMTVAKDEVPRLASYRLYAPDPFRPNLMARIERFETVMTFAEAWADGPLVTAAFDQSVAGSALFQRFDETVEMRVEDITAVD